MSEYNQELLIRAASFKRSVEELANALYASEQTDVAKQINSIKDSLYTALQEGVPSKVRHHFEIRMLSAYKDVQALRNLIRFIRSHNLVSISCDIVLAEAEEMVVMVKAERKKNVTLGNNLYQIKKDTDEI